MNWAIKIISKTLMTKFSLISWGGYYKGFYGTSGQSEMDQQTTFIWD